jgi:hypothetical protein
MVHVERSVIGLWFLVSLRVTPGSVATKVSEIGLKLQRAILTAYHLP